MVYEVDRAENIPIEEAASTVWVTMSELARSRAVSKQAISKRINRLRKKNRRLVRSGPRSTCLVNVALFDFLTGERTDEIRVDETFQGSPREAVFGRSDDTGTLAHQQTRRAYLDAELKRIELGIKQGEFIKIVDVERAVIRAGSALVRLIEQLPARAPDFSAAISRDGEAGARQLLQAFVEEFSNLTNANLCVDSVQRFAPQSDV